MSKIQSLCKIWDLDIDLEIHIWVVKFTDWIK